MDKGAEEEKKKLLSGLLEAMGMVLVELEPGLGNISATDRGFKASAFGDKGYNRMVQAVEEVVKEPGDSLVWTDKFGVSSVVVMTHGAGTLALGPFIYETETRALYQGLLSELPDDLNRVAKSHLESMTQIPATYGRSFSAIDLISVFFPGPYRQPVYSSTGGPASESLPFMVKELTARDAHAIEDRYRKEDAMLEAVARGDAEAALVAYAEFSKSGGVQKRSPDVLRNRQNYAVILNSLLRKTVERAGVHPLYIDYTSTVFALKINDCRTPGQVAEVSREMIREWCRVVREKGLSNLSKIVKDVVIYTDFHYSEDLSLSFFAERMNVTPNHLSKLFSKEMGQSITDYVRKVRVEASMDLMLRSDKPLEEIAELVGYPDPNYFIRVFKKVTGTTPKRWKTRPERIQAPLVK